MVVEYLENNLKIFCKKSIDNDLFIVYNWLSNKLKESERYMKLLMICSLMLVIAFISYVIYDYIVEKDNKEYKEKIVDYICDNSKGLELPKTSGELYVFNKYATDEMINELEI